MKTEFTFYSIKTQYVGSYRTGEWFSPNLDVEMFCMIPRGNAQYFWGAHYATIEECVEAIRKYIDSYGADFSSISYPNWRIIKETHITEILSEVSYVTKDVES